MAGFDNEVMFSSGERLELLTALSQLLLQESATDVGRVSYVGNPEGVVSANPSSLSHNPSTGDIYYKASGTGNTGWSLLSGGSAVDTATANYIVDPLGYKAEYTTIASAIAAASSDGGGTVFIKPGDYEEDLTLASGVNLSAFGCDSFFGTVNIKGKMTATFSGSVAMSGIRLQTNGDYLLECTGSNSGSIYFENCRLFASDFTGILVNNSNFSLRFANSVLSTDSNNIMFAITDIGGVDFRYSTVSSGTNANTIAAGVINFFNCRCQDFSITTSSTGYFNVYNSFFDNSALNQTIFTTAGSGYCVVYNSELFSGTASAASIGVGTTFEISNSVVKSSNVAAITGAGTINYTNLSFTGSSSSVNVTSQSLISTGPNISFAGTSFLKAPIGTTAQRPSSPTAGMFRGNSDLGVPEYYAGSEWINLVSSITYNPDIIAIQDDFIFNLITGANGGNGGWETQIAATGATAPSSGTSTNPGIMELSVSSSTTPDRAVLFRGRTSANYPVALGGGVWRFDYLIKFDTLADMTDDYKAWIGLGNGTSFNTSFNGNGIGFEYDRSTTTNWAPFVESSSSRTNASGGSSVAVGTDWTHLRIEVNADATSVSFYINGTDAGSAASNIPTSALTPELKITKTAGTNARNLKIDAFKLYNKLTTPRWS